MDEPCYTPLKFLEETASQKSRRLGERTLDVDVEIPFALFVNFSPKTRPSVELDYHRNVSKRVDAK